VTFYKFIKLCLFGYKLWWLIGMLLCIVLATGQSAKWPVVWLSSCHPVTNNVCQTARCCVACCHDVTLLLGSNWRIGLAKWQSDIATTRHKITCCLACFARDMMTGRQCPVWRFVMLSLATRRKVDNDIATKQPTMYQISHHNECITVYQRIKISWTLQNNKFCTSFFNLLLKRGSICKSWFHSWIIMSELWIGLNLHAPCRQYLALFTSVTDDFDVQSF
jgi:hypothetical protein